MTVCDVNLSEGLEPGVAPHSSPFRLLVEGWRFRPHSYALVNQQQCLEMLRRPEVDLYYHEARPLAQIGEPVRDLLPAADEASLDAMRKLPRGMIPDAVYRIGYRYDFGGSCAARTFAFATCERMIVRPNQWTPEGRSLNETLRRNNVTVVTPSQWSKRGFVRSGVDAHRIVVVPHGVDPSIFRPLDDEARAKARKDAGCADRFVFLNVSALTGNKNIGGLLEAFAVVVSRHPHARLVLKGLRGIHCSDYWVRNEMAALSPAMRKLVVANLLYTGDAMKTEDVALMHQCADAYVAPYQSEAFNIPVLEAAACGCPVIVTEGGCTDEFATDDFALKVPSVLGDHEHDGSQWLKTKPADIEAQMERAITDSAFRRVARAEGPAHAHGLYTWAHAVDRLLRAMSLKGCPR